jgi:hypothetical protein
MKLRECYIWVLCAAILSKKYPCSFLCKHSKVQYFYPLVHSCETGFLNLWVNFKMLEKREKYYVARHSYPEKCNS